MIELVRFPIHPMRYQLRLSLETIWTCTENMKLLLFIVLFCICLTYVNLQQLEIQQNEEQRQEEQRRQRENTMKLEEEQKRQTLNILTQTFGR